MPQESFFAHPTAVIDPGATIGTGTRIWHFCHLMPLAVVGSNCILGQNVYIDNNVVIGNGVKIQNNVSVYTGVTIEDDVFLGPSMVFTNVINPRSFIERKNEFKKTLLRKGCSIGANATLLCGVEIGSYAMIGAGTVVVSTVPAYGLVLGNPGRRVGWISEAGSTLSFTIDGWAVCEISGKKYRLENEMVFPVL